VRFLFRRLVIYAVGSGNTHGWFVDNISMSSAHEITGATTTAIGPGAAFSWTPTQEGERSLEVRAVGWERFPLEFGPVKEVVVTGPVVPGLAVTGVARAGSEVQITAGAPLIPDGTVFGVEASGAPPLTGWSALAPGAFTVETLVSGQRVLVRVPGATADEGYFRVTASPGG
jgi:hypothetical protein